VQGRRRKPDLFERPGAKILDEDLGALDEAEQQIAALRGPKVERDALLVER
jgi:hypothetical protein